MKAYQRVTILAAAAIRLALPAAPRAAAQQQMFFGDLRVFAQDFLASGDSALSSATGMTPGSQLLAGQARLDLNERLSYSVGQLYVADSAYWWQGSDGGTIQNDLMQAYVSIAPAPVLTVVVGKQRVLWGTGYAFFPGDKINPPINPQNRSEGFYGLAVTLTPSASVAVTGSIRLDTAFPLSAQLPGLPYASAEGLGASLPFLSPYLPSTPGMPWLGLRYALYVEAFLGDLDLHAGMTWQWQRVLRPTAGFSVDVLGFIVDGALAVELSNSDLYPVGEGVYSSPGFGTPFPIVTVGVQRSLSTDSGSLSATLEYLYDSTGYDKEQAARFFSDFFSALSAASGPVIPVNQLLGSAASGAWIASGEVVPALGQQYAALSLSASLNRLVSGTIALVIDLQDLSLALQAELRFTRLEGIDVFGRAITAWGPDSHTEFGSVPFSVAACAGAIVHF